MTPKTKLMRTFCIGLYPSEDVRKRNQNRWNSRKNHHWYIFWYLTTQCSYCFQFFRACVAYHRQHLCKVSMISIENKWSYMHCRGKTVFINNLSIFRRFWNMTRFLKSIIKQKVFIPGLWYLKLEIWSNWKLTYSKIRNFHWKDFELLAFEHVRLKMGHTVFDVSLAVAHYSV